MSYRCIYFGNKEINTTKELFHFSLSDFYGLITSPLIYIYLLFYNVCQPGPLICGIYLLRLVVYVTLQSKHVLYLNDKVEVLELNRCGRIVYCPQTFSLAAQVEYRSDRLRFRTTEPQQAKIQTDVSNNGTGYHRTCFYSALIINFHALC